MSNYFTPGVYIEEISTFPTTVVRVASAVPVFIGNTAKAGADVLNIPTKVKSLAEYESLFGGEPTSTGRTLQVQLSATFAVNTTTVGLSYYLYQSLRHFYANGGGDAYILAVDTYANAVDKTKLINALTVLEKADEPTLVLVPDAFTLDAQGLGDVQVAVLAHCNKMQDRFGIFDVKDTGDATADASTYRTKIGTQNLKYGAAYYPTLQTTITPNGDIPLANLTLSGVPVDPTTGLPTGTNDPAIDLYLGAPADTLALTAAGGDIDYKTLYDAIPPALTTGGAAAVITAHRAEMTARLTEIKKVVDVIYTLGDSTKYSAALRARYAATIASASSALKDIVDLMWKYDDGFRKIEVAGTAAIGVLTTASYNPAGYAGGPAYPLVAIAPAPSDVYPVASAGSIKDSVIAVRSALTTLFNRTLALLTGLKATLVDVRKEATLFATSKIMAGIKESIRSTGYMLPPSGAVAGVYATVDASRGVWKAPANVSIAAVSSVMKMRDDQLDNLNVDTSGKSINAIRLFRGQGILIYGARTLAGNDNEWRYVPVRRLFIMVEESVKKASEPFVFEPNDANTWQRIKGMIENFLLGLWRDGALAGGVPKDAFFVKVGLNQTMTAQDILEGKLIIEIGMAAVRPAEFIILKFMHKLQES